MGATWLFVAMFLFVWGDLEKNPLRYKPLLMGGTLLWMAAIPGGQRIVSAVKSRVTYPRTGYVACSRPKARMWLLPVAIFAVLATLPFGPQRLVLPVTGLVGAAIAVAGALATGVRRVYIPGGIFLLLGLSLGVANVDLNHGFSLLFGLAAAASIVSGALTFRHYLRQS